MSCGMRTSLLQMHCKPSPTTYATRKTKLLIWFFFFHLTSIVCITLLTITLAFFCSYARCTRSVSIGECSITYTHRFLWRNTVLQHILHPVINICTPRFFWHLSLQLVCEKWLKSELWNFVPVDGVARKSTISLILWEDHITHDALHVLQIWLNEFKDSLGDSLGLIITVWKNLVYASDPLMTFVIFFILLLFLRCMV